MNSELHTGQPVVEKDSEGRLEVGYLRANGQVGDKFEVYNNLEGLKSEA